MKPKIVLMDIPKSPDSQPGSNSPNPDKPFQPDPRVEEWVKNLHKGAIADFQLKDLVLRPRELLLGDWLKCGDLGFVFSPRGLGKTFFAMLLGKSLALGTDMGPWKSHAKARVIYLDGEMAPEDLRTRSLLLGEMGEELIYFNHEILFQRTGATMNLADTGFQNGIMTWCLDMAARVLIIDNLSTLSFGVDENKSLDWEKILPWLLTLRRHQITVMIVHHSGRNNEMRGTSKREDPAFWIIRLEEDASEEREGAGFKSVFTKCRNSPRLPMACSWNFKPAGSSLVVHYHEMPSIVTFLELVRDGIDSCKSIANAMNSTESFVCRLAKKAVTLGCITIKQRKYVYIAAYDEKVK